MTTESTILSFVDRHLALLELERQAEVDEARRLRAELPADELERRGLALLRLRCVDESIGLGGRTILELAPTRAEELPANRFSSGDIVTLSGSQNAPSGRTRDLPTGVVVRLRRDWIRVALDRDLEERLDEPIRLDRVANDVTYRRQREALELLRTPPTGGPARRLREVCFGLREPVFDDPRSVEPFDPTLDASQRAALEFLLTARDVALLHGPPGTGKTTTVVELVRHAVTRGDKVLACAGSNVAVDNLVDKLATCGVSVVRLGHPARLNERVLEHSLDALVERAEGTRIVGDLRREIDNVRRQVSRSRDRHQRREHIGDLRRLRREIREIERWTVGQIVDGAQVVLTTNTGAADSILAEREFDLVVLDEAAQSIEASSWVPLLKAKRAVLAGDHRQLPPTVVSRQAARDGLDETLFDRLASQYSDDAMRMLTVQYRMHERIMNWSSQALYDGRLAAADAVREHRLIDLEHVSTAPRDETALPVLMIDTAGCDLEEELEVEGDSRSNEGEAGIVVRHVETLIEAGVRPDEIAVITPYNAQVAKLRLLLERRYDRLEVGSVDGFQGREKEAVIISTVRSNPRGQVGFLADERRMNVAVTRARRHVAIIGDSATIASDPFLAALVEYCEREGEYRSAWEYQ